MNKNQVRNLVRIGMLGAIGFVLMFLEFVVLPAASFLKLSFADVPSLLATFSMGPLAGLGTVLIENLLHACISSTGLVGELANILISGTLVLIAGLIYRFIHTRRGALISLVAGQLGMVIMALLANRFILLPMYGIDASLYRSLLLGGILPFNLIKAAVITLIVMVLYKPLSPLLKGKRG